MVFSRSRAVRSARQIGMVGAALLITACAATPPGADSSDTTAPVRTPLLTNESKTVLGQTITYPADADARVSSAIVQLQPGQETGWHRHDTPLYVHVLEGTVTVSYDGDVVKEYSIGDTFVEAIGTYHNGRNASSKPVRLLTVSMGAEGYADTAPRP